MQYLDNNSIIIVLYLYLYLYLLYLPCIVYVGVLCDFR